MLLMRCKYSVFRQIGDFAYSHDLVRFSVCLFVCITIVRTGRILTKMKNIKKIVLVDFDICHRMASLQKLYFLILTYFSNVKDSNRDLPTEANAHSSVTSVSTAALRVAPQTDTSLPTAVNAHSIVTSASSSTMAIFSAKQVAS